MRKCLAVLLLLTAWVGCSGGAEKTPTPPPAPAPAAPKPIEAIAMSPASFRFSATFPAAVSAQPPGKVFEVPVVIKNTSTETWPGDALADSDKPLSAAYHLYSPKGEQVLKEGGRTRIASSVPPGGEVTLVLKVKAPDTPGKYLLEADVVQERVAWFGPRMTDTPPARIALEVKSPS